MAMSGCPGREALAALVAGNLSGAGLEAVADHLDRCAACRAVAQELDTGPDPAVAALRRRTPTPPAADRNLLFGILALQMDFISRDQLIAAMNAWVLDKAKPLGQILRAQGTLAAD